MSSAREEGLLLDVPGRPDVAARASGTWAGVALALTVGLLIDAAARSGPGLALTLAIWVAVGATFVIVRPRRVAWPFLAAAAVLGALVSLRTSPILLALDVLAAGALLCVGSGFAIIGDPARTTTRSYVVRTVVAPLASSSRGLADLGSPISRGLRDRTSPRAIARAVLLVAPVGLALIALFGSADPVFRRYVHVPGLSPGAWIGHIVWIFVGAVGVTTLLAIGAGRALPLADAAGRRLSATWCRTSEWVALLIVVDALFAVFVAVQFAVFFGGREHVLSVEGLTYAAYARSGFWQLLGASAIAGAVLGVAWLALAHPTPRRQRGIFLALAVPLVASVGVVLVSAFDRLALYEDAYGLTWLRVLVHVTIVDLGLVFACALIAIVLPRASWLPAAAVAIATASVLALNAWNVDAHIAARNVAQVQAGRSLDLDTLSTLSDDAVPTLVASLADLPPAQRNAMIGLLACRAQMHRDTGTTMASTNRSWMHADEALDSLPLPACHSS